MMQKLSTDDLRSMNLLPSEGAVTKRQHGNDEYPRLNKKVFMVGNCFLGGAIELFAKAGCTKASSIEDAELVVFLGGEDVDPNLYGEKPIRGTYFSADRDAREIDAFTKCVANGIPMFGICRGMQFLHVMNGGKLYQDVASHTWTHEIIDLDGKRIRASSMHHQMCIENETTFPIAWAAEPGHSGRYENESGEKIDKDHKDLEAAAYPNINAIAVQGHPEVGGYPEYSIWCLVQLQDFLAELAHVPKSKNPLSEVAFLNRSVNDV